MFSDKREGIGMDEETPLLSILPHVNTVAGSGTSNFPILAHSPRDERESRILKGYLHGQLASVAKFGIWWTMLSPLVLALFNGKTIYVGLTRTAFNSAMLILSPFAGLIVEHRSILTTLNFTNIFRCLIYCILLPFSWMMFRTNWILRDNPNNDTFFLIAFLILMFADGACVTFSNVVDIDCGGTQLLAEQHEISLDDYTRNRYNGLHVAFFDGSIISMCPFVALVGVTVSEFTSLKNLMPTSIFQPSLLLGMMGVTFFVFSSYSLFWYNWRIPRYPRSPIENRNLWSNQFFETLQNLKSGLYFCLGNSFIRWRVFFLAIETAFEDVILSLVIADFCHRILAGDGNYLYANLWSNLLIAFSKSGAVFAAILSQKRWENPPEIPRHFASNKEIAQVVYDFSCISEEAASTVKSLSSVTAQELRSMPAYAYLTQYDQLILEKERDRVFNLRIHHQKFFPLFGFMFVSGMSTLLFPMAHWLYGTFGNPEITCILGFLGGLLYFTFSTAPKIGLSMLLQTLASELDPSGRILMFIATLLTLCDLLLVLIFSAIFYYVDLKISLWLSCGTLAVMTFIQFLFGHRLILRPYKFDYEALLSS